jgi:hypothetical protein
VERGARRDPRPRDEDDERRPDRAWLLTVLRDELADLKARRRGLTIMSRVRAANRGDAWRLTHTEVRELMDVANAPLARV